jgi:hypothetical protein
MKDFFFSLVCYLVDRWLSEADRVTRRSRDWVRSVWRLLHELIFVAPVAVTNFQSSTPRKDFTLPYRAALRHQYSVANFVTLRVLSCLYLPGLRWWYCNDELFCCDLEAWRLVTDALVRPPCSKPEKVHWDISVTKRRATLLISDSGRKYSPKGKRKQEDQWIKPTEGQRLAASSYKGNTQLWCELLCFAIPQMFSA